MHKCILSRLGQSAALAQSAWDGTGSFTEALRPGRELRKKEHLVTSDFGLDCGSGCGSMDISGTDPSRYPQDRIAYVIFSLDFGHWDLQSIPALATSYYVNQ